MSTSNAQSQARTARTEKNGTIRNPDDTRGEGGIGGSSLTDGSVSGGVDGASRTQTATGSAITGGIIAQLINDAENQLGKTRACIEWYQEEEQERLERLENLKRLAQLADQSQDE